MYVIKRTTESGGYVAKPGSYRSYTHDIAKAKLYSTKEKAQADTCSDNEIIIPLRGLFDCD